MSIFRRKRFWSKGKEGAYMVSSDENESSAGKNSPRNRAGSYNSYPRGSIGSACSIASPGGSDDTRSHQLSRQSSVGTRSAFEAHENGLTSSVGLLDVDSEVWDSISLQEQTVRLLASFRNPSMNMQQIQVEIKEDKLAQSRKQAAKEEERHVDPMDTETSAHLKKVVASILQQYKEASSDSGSSIGENLETESPILSDEESSEEETEDEFDFEAHIRKICRRDNGSDSESDGHGSNNSEKALKNAVRKAMRKIKRERSDELADSDNGSMKGTGNERPPNGDGSSSESSDESNDDDGSSGAGSFEMARDVDPEIQELMDGGLIIHPNGDSSNTNEYRTVYKCFMPDEGKIGSIQDPIVNQSEDTRNPPTESHREDNLASNLDENKAQDLRWPFSSFYVKEVRHETPFPKNFEALPSYRSTPASAAHPGRKRNVMLGRVWWVEWWAREDTKMKSGADT
ncbi:suppressor protein SRP40-like [Stylophora pistillata]|uniref:suppressor protein SRP40-like n=1 Tax=Stylophora pistillata TaxID=50429 RepID=UPI000C0474C2|nr:suppressor protein SRP40-like [Stylophora pistillata]